jgi:hypothetical protein
MYDTGGFVAHPTPALCASRGQVLDDGTKDCVTPPSAPSLAPASAPALATFNNQGETYEKDRAWGERIEHGACSRLRDRRTDSPVDIAQCKRDYAMQPLCISYKGFAHAWYDIADNQTPGVSTMAVQMDTINRLGTKTDDPPYYSSPQYQDALRRLLNIAFSPSRSRWSTRDQFADYAYRICMESHPF